MCYHRGWFCVLSVLMLSVPFSGLACLATPSPSHWDEMLVKHKWDATPDNWIIRDHPPNGTTIDFRIALKAERENALIDALHEVSHPRHPKYGAHLSRDQVAELVAPHPDTLELVCSWLKYNGVPSSSISMSHGGSWLTVAGVSVPQANKLLGASYKLYYHAWTNETILRTVGYALPAALHMHVNTVVPTTAFASMGHLQQPTLSHSGGEAADAANLSLGEPSDVLSRRDDDDGGSYVKPSNLRWQYSTVFYKPTAKDRNALGIAGFADEKPGPEDQVAFMTKFRTDVDPNARIVSIVSINGGAGVGDRRKPGKRGNLDTQYSVAMTYPTPIFYYVTGGRRWVDPKSGQPVRGDQYLEWLLYITEAPDIPQTISVPYFTKEPDITAEYAKSLCNMFARLGTRGVSVLVASGDEGVGHWDAYAFYTVFPASCPWVTSVGGTTGMVPERGSLQSGGGFSTFFDREEYQNDAVKPYLRKLKSEYAGRYNPGGRGVPDIAVQSMQYALIFRGKTMMMGGTGCSTNTAAAIFALLNDYLVSKNKSPLGFLNYWLYEAGLYWDGLIDITDGLNPGCGTRGFSAASGWDPVTGLGSMNYITLEKMLDKWA